MKYSVDIHSSKEAKDIWNQEFHRRFEEAQTQMEANLIVDEFIIETARRGFTIRSVRVQAV